VAPFETTQRRQAGTTAVPAMEHFLSKRPEPANVDEIEINDWRDIAHRLGISEDLVHELNTAINFAPARPADGFQLLPTDTTPDRARSLYPGRGRGTGLDARPDME
jgi:hypothetical protein